MGVDALGFIMLMVKRAPLSFEVEDVEVQVLVLGQHMVQESHFDVFH